MAALVVYTREAHPGDGTDEERRTFADHDSAEDRHEAACEFVSRTRLQAPLLKDDMANTSFTAYGVASARLYVIDSRGRVAHKSAESPLTFHPGDLHPILSPLVAP